MRGGVASISDTAVEQATSDLPSNENVHVLTSEQGQALILARGAKEFVCDTQHGSCGRPSCRRGL